MRVWALLVVVLGACTAPWPLDDRPCPCVTGYQCCAVTGSCLPAGQTCPGQVASPDAADAPIVSDGPADAPLVVGMDRAASADRPASVDASAAELPPPDARPLPDVAAAPLPDVAPDLPAVTGPWSNLPAAPDLVARAGHTAVWTGEEMIVWGGVNSRGVLQSGARFDPRTGSWKPTTLDGAPEARRGHTAVWTGQEMIVWGGDLGDERDFPATGGGRYDPKADRWVSMFNGHDNQRTLHSAVWTGEEMIVWGGKQGAEPPADWPGARWHPVKGWAPLSRTNEPPELTYQHTAVWGAGKMILFGGFGVRRVSQVGVPGALYDPRLDAWTQMASVGAPGGRGQHTAIWTGKEMIVWGGLYISGRVPQVVRPDGGRFDPVANRWSAMPADGAAGARYLHTAVWSSGPALPGRMIVWGGLAERLGEASASLATGATYDPASDRWTSLPVTGAPTARCQQVAVWTGSQMLVWGGADVRSMDLVYRADGARLQP